jgi:colanic acid/amylovoran biosynthesis glycosyltransferase
MLPIRPRTDTMHVAFLVNRFPSTSETFVADQIDGLVARGHQVDVYARAPGAGQRRAASGASAAAPRVRYVARPTTRALSLLSARTRSESRRWLRLHAASRSLLSPGEFVQRCRTAGGRHYGAIVAHFGPQGVDGQLLRDAGAIHGPLAVFFHGFDVSELPRRHGADMYADLLSKAELLLPVSDHFRQRLIEMGASPERTRVHRMGVDCGSIAHVSPCWQPGQTLRIVSVARLVEKKGLDVAVPAVARLARDVPELQWTIIGEGPMRRELEASIRKHGAPAKLLGAQPRAVVAGHMRTSHVLLAPSRTSTTGDQEGVPVAIMEAMAHGPIVVSTRHSGIPEVIDGQLRGYLAREGDPQDLFRALVRCLQDRERWSHTTRRARAFAEQQLDRGMLDELLCDRLEELARHGTQPRGGKAAHQGCVAPARSA